MKIGVPSEIKVEEYRVAMTPAGVRELADHGHEVLVQAGAGVGSAFADAEYVAQGAEIVPDAAAVFAAADMIVKVKEPQPSEVALLQPRPHPLHLPAPRPRRGADPGPDRLRRHLRSPTRRSPTPPAACRCWRR